MARIEGFRVRNYRAIRDITLGRLWNEREQEPLTPLTTVIGKNGVGKSTLFDAFGFLSDCLRLGVEEACDARGRGGFDRIRSQGIHEPIEFEIYYKEDAQSRPITYEIAIDIDDYSRPYVARERLRQRRRGPIPRLAFFVPDTQPGAKGSLGRARILEFKRSTEFIPWKN